ncbi:hypothetical protein [Paludifilum halophilum]|uniref:Uncharacterized protein n=1 Tax=Paludifilum halophilum TaxID=1642702 RepID=A0A235BBH9_9BACL|nr:hypothetical protein [Paludifilum halophilum]OYD09668.1 hypothetical protein CHM34_01290 [Paludifilum halophilum]
MAQSQESPSFENNTAYQNSNPFPGGYGGYDPSYAHFPPNFGGYPPMTNHTGGYEGYGGYPNPYGFQGDAQTNIFPFFGFPFFGGFPFFPFFRPFPFFGGRRFF